MSKQRHNLFEVIFILIVVLLTRPLPCIANTLNHRPYGERLMNSKYSYTHNDPSVLFDQLDRDRPAKDFSKWHNLLDIVKIDTAEQLAKTNEKDQLTNWQKNGEYEHLNQEQDLLSPLPITAPSNYAHKQEQRERYFERLQNEAADREFDQVMRKLKSKLHRQREHGSSKENVSKKDENQKISTFCKNSKPKPKLKQTTTTEFPSSVSSTTPPTITKPCKSKTTIRPREELEVEDVDSLLKTAMSMKKHAMIIIRTLNLLEMELLNKWPDNCVKSNEIHSAPMDTSESTNNSQPTDVYGSKNHERLDKPTTPRPYIYNRTFYFGLGTPSKGEDLNLDASFREQRKLEQKVREEYQMQHEILQRLLLQKLENKRKRARYEAAPAAAVRLEVMTTPSSNIAGNMKVNQKIPHAKQSSVAVDNLANKIRIYANRNHIVLDRQPLYSWNIMKKYKRKVKTKM